MENLNFIKFCLMNAFCETNNKKCAEEYRIAIDMINEMINEMIRQYEPLSEKEIEYLWQSSETPRKFAENLLGY